MSEKNEPRIAVVVNGNAKSVTKDVISTLDQILRGSDLFVSRHLDEATHIAETLVERGYGTVLTGGGDGTFTVMVTEVVKVARRKNAPLPRFGLLKLGTGNALSWVVGASAIGKGKGGGRADIERLLKDAGRRSIHLVEVEGYLTPFAGIGADAQILADYNATKAQLAETFLKPISAGLFGYGVAAVTRSLPGYLIKPMPHLRITNTGAEAYPIDEDGNAGEPIPTGHVLYDGKARLAGLSTIPYYGFGFRMFPFVDVNTNRMQLRVSSIGSVEFLRHARGIWNGTYRNPETIFDFLVEKVSIECDPPSDFQIGGDAHGHRARVEAKLTQEVIHLVDHYAWARR